MVRPDDRPPLAPLLRELDEELEQEALPVGACNRIELSIRAHQAATSSRSQGYKRWLPAVTFVAGAALVFALVRTQSQPRSLDSETAVPVGAVSSAAQATPSLVGEFKLAGKDCTGAPSGRAGQAAALLQGNCKLVAPHLTAQVWGEAEVEAADDGLRVHEGQLLFDVEPARSNERPVRIGVSHGTIEVIGTQFIVDQRADGGHVDLFEGAIRFVGANGDLALIGPGQRYRWGAPDRLALADSDDAEIEIFDDDGATPVEGQAEAEGAAASGKAPRRARRKPARSRSARAAAIIERVGELRAEHRYGEAVKQLRLALGQRWDRRTAEVLSYELGELLHRYLGERQAACNHLTEHAQRFSGGRYQTAIERTLDKLQC